MPQTTLPSSRPAIASLIAAALSGLVASTEPAKAEDTPATPPPGAWTLGLVEMPGGAADGKPYAVVQGADGFLMLGCGRGNDAISLVVSMPGRKTPRRLRAATTAEAEIRLSPGDPSVIPATLRVSERPGADGAPYVHLSRSFESGALSHRLRSASRVTIRFPGPGAAKGEGVSFDAANTDIAITHLVSRCGAYS